MYNSSNQTEFELFHLKFINQYQKKHSVTPVVLNIISVTLVVDILLFKMFQSTVK